ncbi:MAG: universal stress protein [Burkholderiaceae bacterium]
MYQKILVPIDGSATSNKGLDEAIRLAQLTGATLRLVHVVDELSISMGMMGYAYSAGTFDGLRAAGADIIEAARSQVAAAGLNVETSLRENVEGPLPDLVLAEARSWKADLIVLGTHGRRGFRRMVLGSSAENIVRTATIPVLLVRAPEIAESGPAEGEPPTHGVLGIDLPAGSVAME